MKTMKLTFAAAALALCSSVGWAADDDAEATIRLMGDAEADLPAAVTKEISLPAYLLEADSKKQEKAVEKAAKGLAKGHTQQNRNNGNNSNSGNNGRDRAEEARERGNEMNEKANENRENRGRSEDRPTPPDSPPGQD